MRGVCVRRGLEPRPKDEALEKLAQRHKNDQSEHGVQQGVPRRPFALLQTVLLACCPPLVLLMLRAMLRRGSGLVPWDFPYSRRLR